MPLCIEKQAISFANDIGEESVIDAIYETALAPRPSWRYTLAILSRCRNEGVTNYDDYIDRKVRFDSYK